MNKPIDSSVDTDTGGSEPSRPSPSRLDTTGEGAHPAPKAGSNEALNEERKTKPSRNRGVTDV